MVFILIKPRILKLLSLAIGIGHLKFNRKDSPMALVVTLRSLETQLKIGDHITIRVCRRKGKEIRIAVEAPKEMKITRTDIPDGTEWEGIKDDKDLPHAS
jgi:carbon storage regulator CsrA